MAREQRKNRDDKLFCISSVEIQLFSIVIDKELQFVLSF